MYFSLSKKSSPSYRADIDGLRGIAVLLVLAFHLGTSKCSGGFIGVDVFFVISGYLIGSIILSEIAASKFSLLSLRAPGSKNRPRAIRDDAGHLAASLQFFLPAELEEFAKSLLASTFSISNVYFFHQSGYFEGPAAMKPLLHTWSLAVEEQFYIFLPLFLIAVRRFFPDRQRVLILSVAMVSFCVSVWGAFHNPSATFYLAHTRAWELLLGTLIALDVFPRFSNTIWRNAASTVVCVLSSLLPLFTNRTTPFPGAAALVPCLGAALIIAAGRSGSSIVSRLLSLSPIVFVGMISYSLYLWHWPMIVFQGVSGILAQGIWPKAAKFVVLAASFLVATLSWKFVEQPFRDRRFTFTRPVLFRIAAASAVAFLALGASALVTRVSRRAFLQKLSAWLPFSKHADPVTESEYRVGTCFLTSRNLQSSFDPSVCLRQDPKKRNELLIGG